MERVEFTLDTQIKSVAAWLNNGYTLKDIAQQLGVSDRELSVALKETGHTYKEKLWIPQDFEDPIRMQPIRNFLKAKPVFNQRQIEKIIQLIDGRLSYEKELSESYISGDIANLNQIETTKKKMKVDRMTLELFEEYCLDNDLDQSAALTLAMQNFLKKYQ